MMGENPSYSYWWSLNGKLQPSPHPSQQAYINNNNPPTNNFLSTPPLPLSVPPPPPPSSSLNHHPYHLFGSSLVVPAAAAAAAAAANPNALGDHHQYHQDFPLSWSQLLLSGLAGNDEEHNLGGGQQVKRHGYEEEESSSRELLLYNNNNINNKNDHINNEEDHEHDHHHHLEAAACSSSWSAASQLINNPVGSSSSSCMSLSTTTTTTTTTTTSTTSNYSMFDFSSVVDTRKQRRHTNHCSSQYDDTSTSGSGTAASKKHRTFHQSPSTQLIPSMAGNETFISVSGTSKRKSLSSTQTPLKVRKEKLGDRISALHQLVSPFGKTDTASVLLEATAQIRFLEGQIQALCSPYMNLGNNVSSAGRSSTRHQHSAPDGKAAAVEEKDLGSRGLCLVAVSCLDDIDTTNIASNGAEFWPPALGGGF